MERRRELKKIPDMDMDVEDDAIKEINKFIKGFINFVQFVSAIDFGEYFTSQPHFVWSNLIADAACALITALKV